MMRKILLVLSLAFAIVMLPFVSLADDDGFSGSDGGSFSNSDGGVVYSKYGNNDTYKVYVRAANRWQAAVYSCGGDPSLLSSEIRSKLSDPNYGGDFYAYAQTFEPMDNFLELPIWVLFGSIDPSDHISEFMESEVSNSFYTSALIDYKVVLAGGDVSGGGSSGDGTSFAGSYGGLQLTAFAQDTTVTSDIRNLSATNAYFDDGVITVTGGTTTISSFKNSQYFVSSIRMYVPSDAIVLANGYISRGYDVVFLANGRFLYGRNLSISYDTAVLSPYKSYNIHGSDAHIVSFHDSSSSNSLFHDADGFFSFREFSADSVTSSNASLPDTFYYMSGVYDSPLDVPSGSTPDGDWPEPSTPVTPDPPEVPTPTAPTETVDPDPTAPTITWPTSPTLVLPTSPIVSTTPGGIDYTALLTLINDNLNSIDAYLQNFYTSFNSFRSDFLNGVDDIVDGLRNIYQYLGHLNNLLEVHCKHITDQIEESVYNLELYLKRLFEWLPRQLDFDAEYDDSAVTALLRRILNKIPGGSTGTPITYKPNPQSDEPSFWDWLADLFNRILQKLLDLLPDEMIQLGQLFGELINLFPFSIPWDLFALLALFGHEPVTPVIDIPWGFGGSSGQVIMVRIDLHAWDGVAEMVRPVFLVLFCLQLALLSRDLLKIINVKSGGE